MTLLDQTPTDLVAEIAGVELRSQRLVLRKPQLADAPAIAALLNDRRIADNLARVPHPYTVADAEEFIARVRSGSELSFVVTLPDDTIVGSCGIARLRGDTPEIGYWFGVPYWGRGHATEATRALLDHAFGELGHKELHAGARITNPASRRVLEKCGFGWMGVALQRVRALNTSVPVDRFRLDRERWAALAAAEPARQVA
jgi:RimJ/RimL family protein N-acetyltransferase